MSDDAEDRLKDRPRQELEKFENQTKQILDSLKLARTRCNSRGQEIMRAISEKNDKIRSLQEELKCAENDLTLVKLKKLELDQKETQTSELYNLIVKILNSKKEETIYDVFDFLRPVQEMVPLTSSSSSATSAGGEHNLKQLVDASTSNGVKNENEVKPPRKLGRPPKQAKLLEESDSVRVTPVQSLPFQSVVDVSQGEFLRIQKKVLDRWKRSVHPNKGALMGYRSWEVKKGLQSIVEMFRVERKPRCVLCNTRIEEGVVMKLPECNECVYHPICGVVQKIFAGSASMPYCVGVCFGVHALDGSKISQAFVELEHDNESELN
jgi:hypothetical protein